MYGFLPVTGFGATPLAIVGLLVTFGGFLLRKASRA